MYAKAGAVSPFPESYAISKILGTYFYSYQGKDPVVGEVQDIMIMEHWY